MECSKTSFGNFLELVPTMLYSSFLWKSINSYVWQKIAVVFLFLLYCGFPPYSVNHMKLLTQETFVKSLIVKKNYVTNILKIKKLKMFANCNFICYQLYLEMHISRILNFSSRNGKSGQFLVEKKPRNREISGKGNPNTSSDPEPILRYF